MAAVRGGRFRIVTENRRAAYQDLYRKYCNLACRLAVFGGKGLGTTNALAARIRP